MEIFVLLMAAAAGGSLLWLAVQTLRPPKGLWRAAAERCGLTHLDESSGLRGRYRFEDGSEVDVWFESYSRADEEDSEKTIRGTRVIVDGAGRLVPLSLSRESRGGLWQKHALGEIQIGDEGFDDDFVVNGPHTFVRAILDADTRRQLSSLLTAADLRVQGGRLQGDVPGRSSGTHEVQVARTVSLLLEAARRLQRPSDLVARLVQNALHDPVAKVRLANLLTLVAEYPERPATERALFEACGDESDMVRVRAAIPRGERGRPILLEIASGSLDDGAGARAVAALDEYLPSDTVSDVLRRALRLRQMQTARACLVTLARRGEAAVRQVVNVLSIEKGELAIVAAEALAATGSPDAEAHLVAALSRNIPELRIAAARGLGRVGSASAVLPLKEAEARHAGETGFSRAAREAVAQIQERLTGASPGQLSLAAAEAGTLSLTEDERGRLSLKDPAPR